MKSYYNTNNESGKELEQSIQQAEKQKAAILKIFQRWGKLTGSEAWKLFDPQGKSPLTSTRRSMTDLYNEGKLVKTKERKKGIYGSPEHYYKLVKLTTNVDKSGQLFF